MFEVALFRIRYLVVGGAHCTSPSRRLVYVLYFLAYLCAARVEKVVVTESNSSTVQLTSSHVTASNVLRAVENQPRPLRCVAFGGYPPPSLDVYVGQRDVTDHFRFDHSAAMSGLRGLRTINYRTERWTQALGVRAEDDQANLKCVATVPGLRPHIETVHLNVECKCTSVIIVIVGVISQFLIENSKTPTYCLKIAKFSYHLSFNAFGRF